jgi:hypothetical protein
MRFLLYRFFRSLTLKSLKLEFLSSMGILNLILDWTPFLIFNLDGNTLKLEFVFGFNCGSLNFTAFKLNQSCIGFRLNRLSTRPFFICSAQFKSLFQVLHGTSLLFLWEIILSIKLWLKFLIATLLSIRLRYVASSFHV